MSESSQGITFAKQNCRLVPRAPVYSQKMLPVTLRRRAPVAQWIEQPPPKGQVGRSIRLRGAIVSRTCDDRLHLRSAVPCKRHRRLARETAACRPRTIVSDQPSPASPGVTRCDTTRDPPSRVVALAFNRCTRAFTGTSLKRLRLLSYAFTRKFGELLLCLVDLSTQFVVRRPQSEVASSRAKPFRIVPNS